MAETIDVQARSDLYDEVIRAKNEETKLAFELEALKAEIEEIKASIAKLSVDEAPTYNSDKLITSGAVYQALQTLNRKIDSLR